MLGTRSRAALRLLCGAVVIALAWSPRFAEAASPSRCPTPGAVYAQTIIVTYHDGRTGTKTVFLVCGRARTVTIVDSDGGKYTDLDDFRAHNHLFGVHDKITLSRDFPRSTRRRTPG